MTHMILCPSCGVNLIPYDDTPLCQECERRETERADAEAAAIARFERLFPALKGVPFPLGDDDRFAVEEVMHYWDDYGELPDDDFFRDLLTSSTS